MFITAAATIPVEPFVSLGGVAITTLGTLGAIWLRARLNRLDAATKPTSNGFTARIEAAIDELTAEVKETRADVGGIRSEIRTERIERIALAAEVNKLKEN